MHVRLEHWLRIVALAAIPMAAGALAARADPALVITHDPLWTTANTGQTQVLVKVAPGTSTPDPNSVETIYHVVYPPGQEMHMFPTANPDEYATSIPMSMGFPGPLIRAGSTMTYRIRAVSLDGDTVYAPADPNAFYSYRVVSVFEPFDYPDPFGELPVWTVGATGDDATAGVWERVTPIGTQAAPDVDFTGPPGTIAFVTQNGLSGGANDAADVDGGRTTLLSPVYDFSDDGPDQVITARYYRWYSNQLGSSVDDAWRVDVSNDGGTNWVNVETVSEGNGGWTPVDVDVTSLIGPPGLIQFRFVAEDRLGDSVVEAGIDDFEMTVLPSSTVAVPPNVGNALAQLGPATPNPAIASVAVSLSLPHAANVKATVRDLQGRIIRTLVDGALPAGATTLQWNGTSERGGRAATGVYFVRVLTGETSLERKVVLVR